VGDPHGGPSRILGKFRCWQKNCFAGGLRGHFDPAYPDFEVAYPDQLRVDEFLNELPVSRLRARLAMMRCAIRIVAAAERSTAGGKKGKAEANRFRWRKRPGVGRVVEAFPNSAYWTTRAILI